MTQNTRFAYVKAGWHADIVDRSLDGFLEVVAREKVDVFDVPGAFELPLMAQKLAQSGRYDAIACAALIGTFAGIVALAASVPLVWWQVLPV